MKKVRNLSDMIHQLNPVVLALVCALSLVGVLMMFSAAGGHLEPWASRQMIRFAVGFVLMIIIAFIPIQFWQRYAYFIYAGGVGMLLVVEVAGFIGMGAQRWVQVGSVNLQPSELMKLGLILALARYYHFAPPENVNRPLWLLIPLLMIGVPAALILHQPNLGTATVLTLMGLSIVFISGLSWRYIVPVVLAGLASLPVLWNLLHDYQKQRVLTFLDPEQDPLGAGYNIIQSTIAIGSGGFFGKGYMDGSQGQLDFLPEKQTDFIFTMISEEFGFVGSLLVLAMYFGLVWMALAIGNRARSHFASCVAVGIGVVLFLHVTINTAMVMGMVPVVGLPLPLISYGGSMQIAMMLGIGLLLNAYVHRDTPLRRGV